MVTYAMLVRPPAVTQFLTRRRNGGRVTGTFDVHTFESFPDWVGPDTGLERALGHLFSRLDPGSYHSACDSDSTEPLIPWWYEAFHDRFTNNWAVSVSIATQAHKWAEAPPAWRLAAIRRAAVEAARIADEIFLERDLSRVATLGIDIPAVWLTQAQAHARMPGFVRHGTSDPGRRSDPWPAGAPEGDVFLGFYKAARTTGRYAGVTAPLIEPAPPAGDPTDVQVLLALAGFYSGRLDGNFGPVSVAAVTAYQEKAGLLVDGWAGPVTLRALEADVSTIVDKIMSELGALRRDVAVVSEKVVKTNHAVGRIEDDWELVVSKVRKTNSAVGRLEAGGIAEQVRPLLEPTAAPAAVEPAAPTKEEGSL